ncbi:MAG: NHL repeat-containing protein [Solirubrobacteraceae bacterium]
MGGVLLFMGNRAQAALVHPYLSQLTEAHGEPFSSQVCGVKVDGSSQQVYVADLGEGMIDVFESSGEYIREIDGSATAEESFLEACSTAVDDTSGRLYVADSGAHLVYAFSAAGKLQKAATLDGSSTPTEEFGEELHVAVDQSSRDVYVADGEDEVVDKFNAAGEYQSQLTGLSRPGAVAVDSSGDVYVVVSPEEAGDQIIEFNSAGSEVRQFTGASVPGGSFGELTGLAVDSAGHLYASDRERRVVDEFDAAGGFMGQIMGSGTPGGSFTEPTGVAVSAAGDVYVADRGSPASVVDIFGPTTPEAPTIESESVANVTSSGATLEAQIDPTGADTTYYFQYGTVSCAASPSSCTSMPAPPGTDIGAGESVVVASTSLQGLRANTTYHYRVLASNVHGTAQGLDQTFTTQPSGTTFALPDGRAWELVSPPDKHGAGILPINEGGSVQASEDGGVITYLTAAASVEIPAGSLLNTAQTVSTRTGGGWSSQDIETPNSAVVGVFAGQGSEYRFFSPDLSLALVEPFGATPLPPLGEGAERTIYLSRPGSGEFEPLVTADNVPAGTKFGGREEKPGVFERGVSFLGATPDLSHVVIESKVALKSGTEAVENGIYEWVGGQLQLVSVLPGGAPATPSTALGYASSDVRHAISNDGSRIVWSEQVGEHHLYMRDTTTAETIQLDAIEENAAHEQASGGPGQAVFQTANSEGSQVFFTDASRLTFDSTAGAGAPDLYEAEVKTEGGRLAVKLSDLSVDEHSGESADLQGTVLGASEDGSYVYFVATGVLSTAENGEREKAVSGAQNLYVLHRTGTEWTTTLIAVLSSEDAPDWEAGPVHNELGKLTSRVSPEGGYVAFMSDRSLTGYENIDAHSGVPDEEVFLYDVGTDGLICASCDPSGARPTGVLDTGSTTPLLHQDTAWSGRWLAGSVPGWTSMTNTRALYQSRYLSDSGRLFFNSPDALVPGDVNGNGDVYEYEPQGLGSCTSSSETFSDRSAGCVSLISSGTSSGEESAFGQEAVFLDASVSGDDVFFLTPNRLAPQDVDTGLDVYDAHVCTTTQPCSTPPVSAPPCSTAEACKPAPSPQPASVAAPGSSTFQGPGNLVVSPSGPMKKSKSLTRAQKLARALRACAKKPKRTRAACRALARRRYGASSQKLAHALKACRKKPKNRRSGCEALARKRYGARHNAKKSKRTRR